MPPAIAGAASAVGGLFGVGATAAAVTTAVTFALHIIVPTVISLGLNKLLNKKPSSNLGNFEGRTQMVRSPISPRQIIYGQARVSGPLVFAHTTGNSNEYLHMIIALAGHEVEEISDVYLNDEIAISGSGTTPISKYTSHLQCVKLLGTDAQTAHATMTSNMSGVWTSNHRLRGIAAIYLRLKWDADVWPGGMPNVSCVVKGKKLYDFRDASTAYSANPVLALYDFMTNARYGLGIPAAALDTAESWEAAADVCDEAVDLDTGGTEPRYTVNGVTSTSAAPTETIDSLTQAMAGRLFYIAGEYRLHAGAYETPTITLDEDDLAGPIVVRSDIPRREKFNSVKGTFANPDDEWQPVDFPAIESAAYETIDNDKLWQDLTLPWTTSSTMAQRLAKIALLRNRQSLTVEVLCKLTAMRVQIGDTVMLDNTRMGWDGKVFEVVEYAFRQASPGVTISMTLQEMASAVYDWSTTDEQALASSPNTTLPDPWTVNPPTSLTLTSNQSTSVQKSDGSWIGRIKATWTNPTDAWVESGGRIEVQYKLSSGSNWITQALMDGAATECFISDLDEGEDYDVRVRAISALGVRSAWASDSDQSVTVDTTGPAPITGLSLAHSLQEFQGPSRDLWFTWTLPTDADLDFVRIRWKVSGAGSWAVTRYTRGDAFLVRGLSVTSAYDFDFTTFDRSGNESAGPNPGYSVGADTLIAAPAPAGVTIGSDGSVLKAVWATTVLINTGGSISADNTWTTTTTVNGARAGDHVTINPASDDGNLKFSARVSANDTVKIIVTNTHSSLGVGFNANVQILVFDIT